MSVKGLEAFASMDWGWQAPGCVLWWLCLPDGTYHIVREYKFQKTLASSVAEAILRITKELGVRLRYVAADPAMWKKEGQGRGESLAETMIKARVPMRKADNDRLNGWARVHALLGMRQDNRPWLTVDPLCKYLLRTLPTAVSDSHNPEDVDTTGDDHALDALRYGAMSRPSPTRIVTDTRPGPGTWGWHTTMDHRPTETGVLA